VAAGRIFAVIERKSDIDALSDAGERPATIVGDISFNDVRFHYKSRPDREILKGVSLTVKGGETLV
jgi:ATP-binding cassette subfamily B (MDR/TAP) protein 1